MVHQVKHKYEIYDYYNDGWHFAESRMITDKDAMDMNRRLRMRKAVKVR